MREASESRTIPARLSLTDDLPFSVVLPNFMSGSPPSTNALVVLVFTLCPVGAIPAQFAPRTVALAFIVAVAELNGMSGLISDAQGVMMTEDRGVAGKFRCVGLSIRVHRRRDEH